MQHFIQSARIATMGWKLVGKNGFLENPDEGWTSPSLRTLYANMLTEQRLGIVYRVVNMLVYFDPMAMCDLPSDLILAPLPAKKQLWEAGDEFVWKAAGQREMGAKTAFGLATHGGLVKLEDRELSCSDAWLPYKCLETRGQPRSTASWEEWCSGIDGFGGLVMLAASLIA